MIKDKIQLASRIEPPLPNGEYTVKVSQSTSIPDCQIADAEYGFQCGADMLSLKPTEIYSVYPPQNSFGNFESVLPHIVFMRRTYPWERPMGTSKELPWLALFLFDETENVKYKAMTCREAFASTPDTYCPVSVPGHEDDMCMVLDVPAKLFCTVCPSREDLKFTAHARCVNRDHKAEESQEIDEWLSVLIGNRTPCCVTGNQGIKNTVYLVSLEFFNEFLNNQNLREKIVSASPFSHVRIPVLYSWDFHSKKDDFNFKTIFESLTPEPLTQNPLTAAPGSLNKILSEGFTPLNHILRDGGKTVSWYRGPLVPYKRTPAQGVPKLFSDAYLTYEPEIGMFDISYASAFTLGRLLSMKNRSFLSALGAWRQKNKRDVANMISNRQIASRLNTSDNEACPINLEDMLHGHLDGIIKQFIREEKKHA